MLKFKIKTKKIDEILDTELEHIKDIVAGEQFHNIFGDKQRIVTNMSPFEAADIKKVFSENEIDENVAENIIYEFIKLIRNYSTENYVYNVDIGKALLIRDTKRIIPKGPKMGEKETKRQYFKLSTITEAINMANEKTLSDELKEKMKMLFPEFNSKGYFFKKDAASHMAHVLIEAARDEQERIENEEPDIYNANKSGMQDARTMTKEVFNVINTMSGDNAIVISRAPVDLIRMSDFPGSKDRKTGIVSCHSPSRKTVNPDGSVERTGEYFECAIFEAKSNGAIAYLVPKKALEEHKESLQKRDFFKDLEREHITGPYPIQRLRLRRYLHIPTETEVLIPEQEVYGQHGANTLVRAVDEWARSVQTQEIQRIKTKGQLNFSDFAFIGGSYFDTSSTKLLESFFGFISSGSGKPAGASEKLLNIDDQQFIRDIGFNADLANRKGLFKVKRISSANSPTISRLAEFKSETIRIDYKEEKQLEQLVKKLNTNQKNYMQDVFNTYFQQEFNLNEFEKFEVTAHNNFTFSLELEFILNLPANGKFTRKNVQDYAMVKKLLDVLHNIHSIKRIIDAKIFADFYQASDNNAQQKTEMREIRMRMKKLVKNRG